MIIYLADDVAAADDVLIPPVMPVPVIDPFQEVQIDHDDGKFRALIQNIPLQGLYHLVIGGLVLSIGVMEALPIWNLQTEAPVSG